MDRESLARQAAERREKRLRDEAVLDACLRAISHKHRRKLLKTLLDDDGSGPRNIYEMSIPLPMTRVSVKKHIGILIDAGLIVAKRRGRAA